MSGISHPRVSSDNQSRSETRISSSHWHRTTGSQHAARAECGRSGMLPLSLSFSGSGHLLCYQLGVAYHLLGRRGVTVTSLAGCSGGAIVAAVASCLPAQSIKAFAQEWAIEGRSWAGLDAALPADVATPASGRLHVGLTECSSSNGGGGGRLAVLSSFSERGELLQALRASCHIPRSFHPFDLCRRTPVYPASEGLQVGDRFFVDGGLSATFIDPAVAVASVRQQQRQQLVVVTPVSGPTATTQSHQRISPTDTSFGVGKFTLPGGQLQGYLSVQNLRGLVMSVGGGTPQALQAQFDLGAHDAASWYEALCRQQ